MRFTISKLLAFTLIAAGLAVTLYPALENLYSNYRMHQSLEQFEATREEAELLLPPNGDEGENYNHHEETSSSGEDELEEEEEEEIDQGPTPIAVLKIDKIQLKLPVLQGASDYNLSFGAGLMDEMAGIGQLGNAVITAHRAHSYGRLFNRLDEVEAGDKIIVTTHDKDFTYQVTQADIVKATDTSVLLGNPNVKQLTLITCHPLQTPNPQYRLVVKALLLE